MSLEGTIDTVNEWADSIDGLTAAGGALNCDALQLQVDTYVKTVTDLILAKVTQMTDLISKYAPILSLPTDPLKILKWAKKVVLGLAGPAIAAAIELAIQIAQLAGAIAKIAGAVASLATKLADCITDLVRNTLDDLADAVMDGAIAIKNEAIGIVDSLKDQALDQLGYDEIVSLSTTVSDAVGEVTTQIDSVSSSVDSVQNSIDGLENITIPG